MARPKSQKPAYCLHKSSGRAFVKIDGKQIPLGRHGSPESRDAYDRKIGEWIARGRQPALAEADSGPVSAAITIHEVVARFWTHAKAYHVGPDGAPTQEQDHFRQALKPVNRLYGPTPAKDFGPLALKAVRAEMLKESTKAHPTTQKDRTRPGWSRKYVNRQVGRIKHAFKWAVENELVPASVYQSLATVAGLRRGHSDARETEPVKPVPMPYVDAACRLVSRQIRAMIQLQLFTGARPGEICRMRGIDLDTTGKVWVYKPPLHKTAHHGHTREIRIGPKARAELEPFLKLDPKAYIFSPADADRERRAALHKARVENGTPLSYGNRPGTNRRKHPKKKPGERYTVGSYRAAITRACLKADALERAKHPDAKPEDVFVPCFHPHQLRHNAATALRKEYGLEAARIILGHRSAAVTTIYAEADALKATEIMGKVG